MKKKIFISWSGNLGKEIAEVFGNWLKEILPIDELFCSTDLRASSNWYEELKKGLKSSNLGIFCLTDHALSSTWMFYEVGFLNGKKKKKNHDFNHLIYPILFDLKQSNVDRTIFNYIQNSNFKKKQIKNLIIDIAEYHFPSVETETIITSFESKWKMLNKEVKQIIDNNTQKQNIPKNVFEKMDNIYVVIGFDNLGEMIVKELLLHNNQVIVIDINKRLASTNETDIIDYQLIPINGSTSYSINKENTILCINNTIDELFKDLYKNKQNSFLKKLENKNILSFMITLTDHLLIQNILGYLCQAPWKKKKPFIISRAATKENVQALKGIGADAAVIPETTGSIEFASFSKIISAKEINILSYELKIPNIPGSLNGVTSILSEWGINIEFAKLVSTTPFVSTWVFEGFFRFEYIIEKLENYFKDNDNIDLLINFIDRSNNLNLNKNMIIREFNKDFKKFINRYNNEIFKYLKENVIESELQRYVCGKDRVKSCNIKEKCGRMYCKNKLFCCKDKSDKFSNFLIE